MFIKAFERDSEWHPSPFHGIDEDFHHVRTVDRSVDNARSIDDTEPERRQGEPERERGDL